MDAFIRIRRIGEEVILARVVQIVGPNKHKDNQKENEATKLTTDPIIRLSLLHRVPLLFILNEQFQI